MNRILIVSSNGKSVPMISEMLEELSYDIIDCASTAAAAHDMVKKEEYAVIIISAPLADEPGNRLAKNIVEEAVSGVVMLMRRQAGDDFAVLENLGVMMLEKPVAKQLLLQAVRHAHATWRRMCNLKRENLRLQYKLDETYIVSRAKSTLMMHLNMTEDQAHRYIEKQAMDLCTTRMDVAKNVLKNYMP